MAIGLRAARQERAARNQSLFRGVNERLEEAMRALPTAQDFLCECANRDCNKMLSITVAEYETVRGEPTHFAIAPGHELLEVERVVLHGEGRYTVVEKIERAAEISVLLDPRRA